MQAIILAGGLGTRLREAVPDVPKPMALVNGRPFLEYQLDYWLDQGVERFIISVGYLHHLIQEHFGAIYRGREVVYACEDEALGTGGGLLLSLTRLTSDSPCLIANGDTFFEVELSRLRRYHQEKEADVTIGLFRTEPDSRYGEVVVDDQGRVTSFRATNQGQARLANGGVYLAHPLAFLDLDWQAGDKVSLEAELFPAMIRAGRRLYGLEVQGRFIDIGLPEDFYRASNVEAPGTGLGLPIVKRIVESHGGRIEAVSPISETGTGCRFTFTLAVTEKTD